MMKEANVLVCPHCKNPLYYRLEKLNCVKCSICWPVKDGIPIFSNDGTIHPNRIEDNEIKELAHTAESDGWDTAFYNYTKAKILRNESLSEDQRVVDWIYRLSLDNKYTTLVLGCGLGTVPLALSETCGQVYAIDSNWDHIAFLNIRIRQQCIDNIFPIYLGRGLDFPFPEKFFDLISVKEFPQRVGQRAPFREMAKRVYSLLRGGGEVHLSLGNRWAFQRLFRRENKNSSLSLHTFFGYKRILQAEGFSEIQFYAPLPHHDGIPLFYIPLKGSQAITFFLKNIFPLFDMVSPEVKQLYALEYKIAKIGVRLALIFRLSGLFKIFVPGFGIIAKKSK